MGVLWCLGPFGGQAAAPVLSGDQSRAGEDFFERRIRPVLIGKCYNCHSVASQKSEGGVNLDSPAALLQTGEKGPVLVPGDPSNSRLVQILRTAHPGTNSSKDRIVSGVVASDFEAWVRMGAPDPRSRPSRARPDQGSHGQHWAFQPISQPAVPMVRDLGWVADPVDSFVLAKLEQSGVRPAAPANRATWIRRVSFDLTGLLPTPEEVDAFVSDPSPTAYARVVDRLLESPHFGEHWGRHWLELVHFADFGARSSPYENAWRYRDYVVGAFNSNKRYDDFIREQLAGDLLDAEATATEARRQHLIATGFLMVGPRALESKRSKLLLDVADDQLEITTRSFLALTVACARCHDHKSDPISMRDYYGLAGIFSSTACLADGVEPGARGAQQWRETSLASPDQIQQVHEFETRLEELKEQWREAREMKIAVPGEIDSTALVGVVVDNLAAEVHGAWKESNYSTNFFVDRNYLHDGDADKGRKSVRFIPEMPSEGVYEVLVSYTPRANRATNVPVTITSKTGSKTVLLNQTLVPTVDKVFASVGKFPFAAGTAGSVLIANQGTKGFVVVDAVRFVPVNEAAALGAAAAPTEETALLNFRQLDKELREFGSKRPELPQAMAVQEGNLRDGRIRLDGDPDRPGEEVQRGVLAALAVPESTLYVITDESSGRLELAHWIATPENPLTARVAVNRVWAELFGKGLVESTDDFGSRTERPVHAGLLDHLAQRFIAEGWSFKKLIRSLTLSSTYQMSSRPDPTAVTKDPANRLWSRMEPRPLAPEELRDALLTLSRELDRTVGGSWLPTNLPPLSAIQAARRVQTTGERRSLYLPVIRDRSPEPLRTLTFTNAESVALVPEAALAKPAPPGLLEDRFVSERIWKWSDWLLHTGPDSVTNRVTIAFWEALGRRPSDAEVEQAARMVQGKAAPGAKAGNQAPKNSSSGWEAFCGALFASDEFRFLQ